MACRPFKTGDAQLECFRTAVTRCDLILLYANSVCSRASWDAPHHNRASAHENRSCDCSIELMPYMGRKLHE